MVVALLDGLWPVLVAVAVRVTPLFLAALLIERVLRRRSATVRHAMWRATLGGTIALGVGAVVLPRWNVGLLPSPPVLSTVEPSWFADPERAAAPHAAPVADGPARTTQAAPLTAGLAALWLAVCSAMLLRLLLSHRALHRSARRAQPAGDGAVAGLATRLARELGIRQPVRLLLHDDAVIPHTFGVWRATLVLPRDVERWSADRQERVITHELGHVQRGDALECLLAQCATAMLWFHPGVWLMSRRLAATREAACDDLVLLRGARASDYATDLLDAVRHAQGMRPPAAAPAMARRSELGARLADILDATRPRRVDARAPRRLMGAACVVLTLPVAALHPVPREAALVRPAAEPVVRVASLPADTPPADTTPADAPRADAPPPNSAPPDAWPLDAIVAARISSLDSICAITNGRTRGELLVALVDEWVEDARFLEAYFRVLDGIPDARVRADVVEHALTASRTTSTRAHARTIIEGLPDRRLREAMAMRLDAMYATAGGSP
jgi:beta-lactamase regulating signal transducer with metallopeptidase domain